MWAVLLLGCSGPTPVTSSIPTGDEPLVREWVSLTAHPCALDSDGYLDCWISEEWAYEGFSQGFQMLHEHSTDADYISSTYLPDVFAHRVDGRTTSEICSNDNWICRPPNVPWRDAGWRSGITSSGTLATWGEDVWHETEDTSMHALAGGVTPAAVSASHEVVTLIRRVEERLAIPHQREVTHLAPGFWGASDPRSACVLDVTGEITCFGVGLMAEAEFPNPPYRDLDGDRGVACAIREADEIIDCSDGTVHDFGPIQELQVYPYQQLVDDERDYTQASLCVITTGNAIRCAGPHYPPDLHAQLAALPQ